jgi:hypothetical protein
MEVLVSRGCGLEVPKATVVACLLTGEPGRLPRKQVKTFSTLRERSDRTARLVKHRRLHGRRHGSDRRLLEAGLHHSRRSLRVDRRAAARHIKAVPGRKTDVKDAEWIADLLRHGLLQPSYVPPPELRELRSLLRYRVKLVNARSGERNRIIKLLESANLKISSIVSDVFGVSGRLMLEALWASARPRRKRWPN